MPAVPLDQGGWHVWGSRLNASPRVTKKVIVNINVAMVLSGLLPGGVIRDLILAETTRKTDSCPICRRENSKISPYR